MPKVLFVVPHLSNSLRLLADYLRYLDRAFEVTLLALDDDRRFEHEFPPDARKIILPRMWRRISPIKQIFHIFRAARGHDLLVAWPELTPTYQTYIAGALRGIPVIGWVHAHLSRVFELRQRPGSLHRPVMNFVYPRLAAVIGCSDGVGEDLRNHFGLLNAGAIPNGIDVDRVRRLSLEPVPQHLQHIFDKPTMVNVAALHFQKNQQLLIRAHALLRKEGIDHHLLFVGSGPLEQELRALIKELDVEQSVFFSGYVDNPYPLIRASRLFVLSSHWEGLPLVLPEAMAIGAAVVSTDCPSGPREILDGGRYGALVPVNELDPLVEAVREVLSSDATLAQMRRLAGEGAERMSIKPRAEQMGQLFRKVLETHGSARAEADEESETLLYTKR